MAPPIDLTVSSYDTLENLGFMYKELQTTLGELKRNNVSVHFDVDATKL